MEVVKAVICKNKKYLLQLRDDNSLITYPNTWSFFGGEVDENEGLLEALKRELLEELNWKFRIPKNIKKTRYEKSECNITFFLIKCNISNDKFKLGEGQAMAWFSYEDILNLSLVSDRNQSLVSKESILAIDSLNPQT